MSRARFQNDTKTAIAPCTASLVEAIEGTRPEGHALARPEITEGKTRGAAKS